MLVELWRHGARAAAYNTFNQEYVKAEGPGNLMGNGMRMHYVLGQSIRAKYKNSLFKDAPKNSDYEVTSSQFERTMMSAYSHMLGIYPLGFGKLATNNVESTKNPPFANHQPQPTGWDPNYALEKGYRPVPVNVIPKQKDDFFMKGIAKICPKGEETINEEFAKRIKMPERMQLISKVAAGIKEAGYSSEKYFNEPQWTIKSAGIFSDVDKCYYIYSGEYMGITPGKTVAPIKNALDWTFGVYYLDSHYPNDDIVTYYTTNQAKYIIKKMKDKMDSSNPSTLKYVGMSGHESNIIPFQLNYNLTNLECMIENLKKETEGSVPGCELPCAFASNFMWELSQDENTKEWYVGTYYNNKLVKSCDNPEQDMYCKFTNFESFLEKHFILSDSKIEEVCGTKKSILKEKGIWFWIAIAVIILFLVQLFAFITYYRKTKQEVKLDNTIDEESMDINDRFLKKDEQA